VEKIEYNDTLYIVYGKVPITTELSIEELRKGYNTDIILRKDNLYYMCDEIIEAEFEEIPKVDK
jgi:hypothetical protein|tara:strand:+ start:1179 stop:1370 length:192 start_codon:yes stop_codon:yes gene_type:complete